MVRKLAATLLSLVALLATLLGTRHSTSASPAPAEEEYPPVPAPQLTSEGASAKWRSVLQQLQARGARKYVIVNAKNGLGNRLRALATALAVAADLQRPVLLVWVPDLHCNCSFRSLYKAPWPFALLEEEIPFDEMSPALFDKYNYMRPEPGAIKDEVVEADESKHIYFKSGFIMNHPSGDWTHAQHYMRQLKPSDEVQRKLATDRTMIGVHVRTVMDAPRDKASSKDHVGTAAVAGAEKEYGKEGTEALLKWRAASHWSNFVERMQQLLDQHAKRLPPPKAPLRFYLAADSEEAYVGLIRRFPKNIVATRRQCASERCDFRDCSSLVYSLVDMLNLANTSLILGSGYSSYSEVASWFGARTQTKGTLPTPLRLEMAGRDFGAEILGQRQMVDPMTKASTRCPAWEDVMNTPKDSRWKIWKAGPSARNCSTGCVMKLCNEERDAPCCVKRHSAIWPVPCEELINGCGRNASNLVPGHLVIDRHAVPLQLSPSKTCPTREDVLNTFGDVRWKLWDDPSCDDNCGLAWCNGGKLAPCCVKRQEAVWTEPDLCNTLPAGCFSPNSSLSIKGAVVHDWLIEVDIVVANAVPILSPSDRCPSREDVLNTGGSHRWALWNDPTCQDNCSFVRCNHGRLAPCCVKRQRASFAFDCDRLASGCYERFSLWWWRGLIVRDTSTQGYVAYLASIPPLTWLMAGLGLAFSCFLCICKPASCAPMLRIGGIIMRRRGALLSWITAQWGRLFAIVWLLGCIGFYLLPAFSPSSERVAAQTMQEHIMSLPAIMLTATSAPPPSPPSSSASKTQSVPPEYFKSPRWLVENETSKDGAGLLFFAYGAAKTLNHFLLEAESAARTFRMHNPGISITVVTNNQTVRRSIFDKHIMPRMDLLFPGDTDNVGQNRGDNLPRQWLTRLYYLAHSPYLVTWALDSNVISCTPGAAHVFLQRALANRLWGYHIAHASQNQLSEVMYPHNFNIIYQWREETSALLRDWFLITMRYGVTGDDQKTLHIAELRHLFRTGLNVGRIAPEYGGAFYNVYSEHGATKLRPDRARVTPVLSGRVHVIHSPNLSLCTAFNEYPTTKRQMLMRTMGEIPPVADGELARPILHYQTMTSTGQCVAKLSKDDGRYCLLNEPPSKLTVGHEDTVTSSGLVGDTVLEPQDNPYIKPVMMEDYRLYVETARCGALCTDIITSDTLGHIPLDAMQRIEDRPLYTRCLTNFAEGGVGLKHLERQQAACDGGPNFPSREAASHVLRGFRITRRGCPIKLADKAKLWIRYSYRCSYNAPPGAEYMTVERYSGCAPARGASISQLSAHSVVCPDGYALTSFAFRSDGCLEPEHMQFRYSCASILIAKPALPDRNASDQFRTALLLRAATDSDRARSRRAGGEMHGDRLPVRQRFESATECSPAGDTLEALEPHALSCPPTHALHSFRFEACGDPYLYRFVFACLPTALE
jgi:hypothetical protein